MMMMMMCVVSRRKQGNDKPDKTGKMGEFFVWKNLHPLLLSLTLMFLQNWCGVNVLVFKTVDVFSATGSSIDNYLATSIVGFVQLLSTGRM